jgi:hypothetical protein
MILLSCLENLHQRFKFLAAFGAEPEVLFDFGNAGNRA